MYIRPSLTVGFQMQSIQRFRYKSIQTLRHGKVVSILGRDGGKMSKSVIDDINGDKDSFYVKYVE